MNYNFTSDFDLKSTIEFLAGPRLWVPRTQYPDFLYWLDKVEYELENQTKRGLFCYVNSELIGSVIFQRHKTNKDYLEIKNLTISPNHKKRFIASFLLRNAEIEGKRLFNSTNCICDAKANNINITTFLLKHHYTISGMTDLYNIKSGIDNVFIKPLKN